MNLEQLYSVYRRLLSDILNILISFAWGIFIFNKLGWLNLDFDSFIDLIYELNIKIDLTSLIILVLIIVLFMTPLGISLNATSYFFLEPLIYFLSYNFFKLNIKFIFPRNQDLNFLSKKINFNQYSKFIDDLFILSQNLNKSIILEQAPVRGFYIFSRSFAFINLVYLILAILKLKLSLILTLSLFFILFLILTTLGSNYIIDELFENFKMKCFLEENFKEKTEFFIRKYNLEEILNEEKK